MYWAYLSCRLLVHTENACRNEYENKRISFRHTKTSHVSITSVILRFTNEVLKKAYVMLCAISYHLYNLKNVKNTNGGVLLLVKLQTSAYNFIKSNTPPRVYFQFLNCTNGTKSQRVS